MNKFDNIKKGDKVLIPNRIVYNYRADRVFLV